MGAFFLAVASPLLTNELALSQPPVTEDTAHPAEQAEDVEPAPRN